MPICLNIPSIPNVRASSGTIGTTRSPKFLSLIKLLIALTQWVVVDTCLSPLPFKIELNILESANFRDSSCCLLLGINPPKFFLVFLRYCISGESSAGLTYGNCSISLSVTGISNLSLKLLIFSNDNFLTWWVVLSASREPTPYPLVVNARITVGDPLWFTAWW